MFKKKNEGTLHSLSMYVLDYWVGVDGFSFIIIWNTYELKDV